MIEMTCMLPDVTVHKRSLVWSQLQWFSNGIRSYHWSVNGYRAIWSCWITPLTPSYWNKHIFALRKMKVQHQNWDLGSLWFYFLRLHKQTQINYIDDLLVYIKQGKSVSLLVLYWEFIIIFNGNTYVAQYIHSYEHVGECRCVSVWRCNMLNTRSSVFITRVQYWLFIRGIVDLMIIRTAAWTLFLCLVDLALNFFLESKPVLGITSNHFCSFLDLNSKNCMFM